MNVHRTATPMVFLVDNQLIVQRFISAQIELRISGTRGKHLSQTGFPWSEHLAGEAAQALQSLRIHQVPLTEGCEARLMPDAECGGLAIIIDRSRRQANDTALDGTRQMLSAARHQFVNSLQLMRSVIRRSSYSAQNVETYSQQLEGRLDALSRVLSTLIRDPSADFSLSILIYEALEEHRLMQWSGCPEMDGPAIRISATAAPTMALLFHELASNGIQHGLLGAESEECLSITWRVEDELLRIFWMERGCHFQPGVPGFGMWVMDDVVAYELNGIVRRNATTGGFCIQIDVPMDRIGAIETRQDQRTDV